MQSAFDPQSAFAEASRHHRAGRVEDAERLYREILRANPQHAESLYLLGLTSIQAKRTDDAIAFLEKAIGVNPAAVVYHIALGNVFYGQSRFDDAARAYRAATALEPDNADATYNLGNCLLLLGRLDEAVATYRQVIALNPSLREAYNNLGEALQQQGRFDEAVACYRQILALLPQYAIALSNLGNALCRQGRLEEAVPEYRRAIALKPAYAEAHNNLGNALHGLGRLEEARDVYQRAIAIRPGYAEAHNGLGNALQDLGRLDEGCTQYRAALELNPDYAEAHNNLGNTLQEQGRLDEAVLSFERAIALSPRQCTFYRMLAETGRLGPTSPHVRRMEQLLAEQPALAEADQMELRFALGFVYANHGQNDVSFRHLLVGNALKRARTAYDEAAALALFQRISKTFTADFFAHRNRTGDPSRVPIFVLGMPRSGTTLVEQILASHPDVFGAGELLDLPQVVATLQGAERNTAFPEICTSLPPSQFAEVGAAYVARLRARVEPALRVVDKLPENFLRIGLIRTALPGARIIHVRRDPVDTCLSCFSKLFAGHIPYAYDLAELGRYYRAYERLMDHWRAVLPPNAMLEIRYEELVGNFADQVRRLLDYCDLSWNDNCLAFHRTDRNVQTASATQVRQPLYTSAVGRWHQIGELAQPLLDALSQ